jgi:hypothetical protein
VLIDTREEIELEQNVGYFFVLPNAPELASGEMQG